MQNPAVWTLSSPPQGADRSVLDAYSGEPRETLHILIRRNCPSGGGGPKEAQSAATCDARKPTAGAIWFGLIRTVENDASGLFAIHVEPRSEERLSPLRAMHCAGLRPI